MAVEIAVVRSIECTCLQSLVLSPPRSRWNCIATGVDLWNPLGVQHEWLCGIELIYCCYANGSACCVSLADFRICIIWMRDFYLQVVEREGCVLEFCMVIMVMSNASQCILSPIVGILKSSRLNSHQSLIRVYNSLIPSFVNYFAWSSTWPDWIGGWLVLVYYWFITHLLADERIYAPRWCFSSIGVLGSCGFICWIVYDVSWNIHGSEFNCRCCCCIRSSRLL